MLDAGTQLGPYRLEGRLGRGAMGEVWRARDVRLERSVALKLLDERLASRTDLVTRFLDEAQAAGRIGHPNVLTVYDVGHHDQRPYIVSELLEGESLYDRLQRGPLSQEEAARLGRDLARGLAAAHGSGVIHRDLKPSNLFLTSGGLKILDFGLARLSAETRTHGTLTAPGAVMGTLGYMSPEQLRGDRADARSDLFSAGCVLYELWSGKHPFEGRSAFEIGYAIERSEPPPLPEGAPAQAVMKCLRKKPEERWQTAAELAAALEAPPVKVRRRVRPWMFAPLALLLLVFVPRRAPAVAIGSFGNDPLATPLREALRHELRADDSAARVLTGAVRRWNGKVRVDAIVRDLRTGEGLASASVTGAGVDDLARRLAGELR